MAIDRFNPNKTSIIDLPVSMEDLWASEIRTFSIASSNQIWNLRRYFDRAFELYIIKRKPPVLQYAIQRLRGIGIEEEAWKITQDFLLQCAMIEPSTLPSIVDHLHYYQTRDFQLDGAKASQAFSLLIREHAPLGMAVRSLGRYGETYSLSSLSKKRPLRRWQYLMTHSWHC